jgi:hypothetical protein
MNNLKYIGVFITIYIIFRLIYIILNKNHQSETYIESHSNFTKNIKILYENLLGTSNPSNSNNMLINNLNKKDLLKSYQSYLNSPSKTINIAITSSSGAITTIPCIGNCINCVVTSLTPSGCYVSEKI